MQNAEQEKLVFVDIETAGLERWRPIIQIAAIAVDSNLEIQEEFDERILFSNEDADPKSLNKNSYCQRIWQRRGLEKKVAAINFAQFLRRHATVDLRSTGGKIYQLAQLVAHNSHFDSEFLIHWYRKMDFYFPALPRSLCTLQRAMWLIEENKTLSPPQDFKLQTLCDYFGVRLGKEKAHDAYFDVLATLEPVSYTHLTLPTKRIV